MSTTEEKREEIISEKNTAQQEFLFILDKLNKDHCDEIRFENPMHGDVDFSILKDRGFKHVTKIIFDQPGVITNIRNIPEGIKALQCEGQMLTELNGLPETMEELHLDKNFLLKFDAKGTPALKILKISNNDLDVLENLPETIEEIECDNNHIKQIDLTNCLSVRLLHCSNNHLLIISNPPESLVDFEMENNPLLEIKRDDLEEEGKEKKEKRLDYLESMNEYFALKRKYEEKRAQMKRGIVERAVNKKSGLKKARNANPPCISCKRTVGTIFSRMNGKYMAVCGDKKAPCNLNIQIFSGIYFSNEILLGFYKEDLEKSKEEIIKHKMDTLFSYISEEQSVSDFKKLLEDYNKDSNMYKDLLKKYKDLYENEERTIQQSKKTVEIYELLDEVKKQLDEYEKTQNRKSLMSAMHIYKRDLIPAITAKRMNKYKTMEMDVNGENTASKLVQKEIALHDMDFTYGEPPRVVKFSVTSGN